MKKTIFIALCVLNITVLFGQTQRNIIASKYSEVMLKETLRSPEKWYDEPVYPSAEFAKKYNFNERTVYWNIKKHKSNRIPCGKLAGFILDTKA